MRRYAIQATKPASKALFLITFERKSGYIDRRGGIVVPPRFAAVREFCEGLAAVQLESGGPWGFINVTGQMAIEPPYYATGLLREGWHL